VTIALLTAASIASALAHFPFLVLMIPATAVWATLDASKIHRRYRSDPLDMPTRDSIARLQCSKPVIVFAACFANWFLGFPWYLVMRDVLITNAPMTAKGINDNENAENNR